jgi:hypothetical protein
MNCARGARTTDRCGSYHRLHPLSSGILQPPRGMSTGQFVAAKYARRKRTIEVAISARRIGAFR